MSDIEIRVYCISHIVGRKKIKVKMVEWAGGGDFCARHQGC